MVCVSMYVLDWDSLTLSWRRKKNTKKQKTIVNEAKGPYVCRNSKKKKQPTKQRQNIKWIILPIFNGVIKYVQRSHHLFIIWTSGFIKIHNHNSNNNNKWRCWRMTMTWFVVFQTPKKNSDVASGWRWIETSLFKDRNNQQILPFCRGCVCVRELWLLTSFLIVQYIFSHLTPVLNRPNNKLPDVYMCVSDYDMAAGMWISVKKKKFVLHSPHLNCGCK